MIVLLGIGLYTANFIIGRPKQIAEVHNGVAPNLKQDHQPIQELPALSVETEPAGASILMDGVAPQKPPNTFTHVPFGIHQVVASLEGYESVKQEIQVSQGTPGRLNMPLKAIQELGALSIDTEPAGALILMDGLPPQKPPNTFTHVPFGIHQVVASLEGYESVKQEIQVSQGTPGRLNLPLKAIQELGVLSIDTEPAGAFILMDGIPPQKPPNTFTHVPFGIHQVVASLEGYESVKQEIQVAQGTPGRLNLPLKAIQELGALSIDTEPAGASILMDGVQPQAAEHIYPYSIWIPSGNGELGGLRAGQTRDPSLQRNAGPAEFVAYRQ